MYRCVVATKRLNCYRLPWSALQEHRVGQQRPIELRLSASEFLDRVGLLIPPPRKHRHRYFGVLAQRRAGRLVAGANWVVDPVPGYVERDLRKFLECGFLAHGFARA